MVADVGKGVLSSALLCGSSPSRLLQGLTRVVVSALLPFPHGPYLPVVGTRSPKVHSVLGGHREPSWPCPPPGSQCCCCTSRCGGSRQSSLAPGPGRCLTLAHHAPLVL